jgi:hypothetical protein
MLLTAVLVALVAQAEESRAGWAGTWKSADPAVYATITIEAVDAAGFALAWDENVGINSARGNGRAAWLAGAGARFESDSCSLTIERAPDDRLLATIDELSCFNWSSHERLVFVREGVTVHERASFDCRKAATPVERAICADRDLAEADRLLAAAYAAAGGSGKDARLEAAQRAWVAERDRRCGPEKEPARCLFRAYGRRILEMRAWPDAAFGKGGRPDVAVLARALRGDVATSGLRELAAGLVGGIPAEMDLDPRTDEPAGLAFSGCDEPDPSRGWDPLGRNCGRTHYIAFLRNGETWAARADADRVTIAPTPKARQRLPASLEAYQEDPWPPDEEPEPQP